MGNTNSKPSPKRPLRGADLWDYRPGPNDPYYWCRAPDLWTIASEHEVEINEILPSGERVRRELDDIEADLVIHEIKDGRRVLRKIEDIPMSQFNLAGTATAKWVMALEDTFEDMTEIEKEWWETEVAWKWMFGNEDEENGHEKGWEDAELLYEQAEFKDDEWEIVAEEAKEKEGETINSLSGCVRSA